MELNFRLFVECEAEKQAKETIKRLPKKHQALVKGFKIEFETGTNLKGYKDSTVGIVNVGDKKNKFLKVSAPWRYSREFTTLHEIGHLVYNELMTDDLKKEWVKVAKKNKRQNQDNAEENFCMAYAATYCNHPPLTHYHTKWVNFIKKKVPH